MASIQSDVSLKDINILLISPGIPIHLSSREITHVIFPHHIFSANQLGTETVKVTVSIVEFISANPTEDKSIGCGLSPPVGEGQSFQKEKSPFRLIIG